MTPIPPPAVEREQQAAFSEALALTYAPLACLNAVADLCGDLPRYPSVRAAYPSGISLRWCLADQEVMDVLVRADGTQFDYCRWSTSRSVDHIDGLTAEETKRIVSGALQPPDAGPGGLG